MIDPFFVKSAVQNKSIKDRDKLLHPQYMWDVTICPCSWYLLLAQQFWRSFMWTYGNYRI